MEEAERIQSKETIVLPKKTLAQLQREKKQEELLLEIDYSSYLLSRYELTSDFEVVFLPTDRSANKLAYKMNIIRDHLRTILEVN